MPIVFFNACSGSAPDAFATEGFVSAFQKSGCIAVIAPEADIEVGFAGWFASRFFERLIKGMPLEASLADLVYEVRAEGRPRHMGLCGLLYSVNSLTPVAFQRALQEGIEPAAAIQQPSEDAGPEQRLA